MKKLIAFILMPVAAILFLFKKALEPIIALSEGIAKTLEYIDETNFKFWAKVFKWKE